MIAFEALQSVGQKVDTPSQKHREEVMIVNTESYRFLLIENGGGRVGLTNQRND